MDNIPKMDNIVKIISIDSDCYQTFPCQHYIRYQLNSGEIRDALWFVQNIHRLCKKLNYKIPTHTQTEYENFLKSDYCGVPAPHAGHV